MSEFVLLYRGVSRNGTPEQMQQQTQRWGAWLKGLSEKGHVKDFGHPLEVTGKVVKGNGKSVTDGPFAEAKDLIGGYTLIEARDLDHAAELSAECPIFSAGGVVEVRPIRKMNM